MRIVIISDINNTNSEIVKTGNQLFEHCGNIDISIVQEIYKSYGYETVIYNTKMKINKSDIVLFSDRINFYKGWRFLCRKGLIRNTICIMTESEVVDRKCSTMYLQVIKDAFPIIMTYQDEIIDNVKFHKYWPSINCNTYMEKSKIGYQEKRLAVIICTNQLHDQMPGELYSERKKVIEYFESNGQYTFGVYGRYWDGYRNWGGACRSKAEIYHKYRFAICLENSRANGYITEKIFDCFQCGIVPVYGGALNVTDYIPSNCYIDYFSFCNLDEMVNYLDNMNEEEYSKYLNAIQSFLGSEKLKEFNVESRVGKLCSVISDLPGKMKIRLQVHINMFIKFGIDEWRVRLIQSATYVKNRIPLIRRLKIKIKH